MEGNCVYFNGEVVPSGQAGLSVFDTGLLHGASVFTTMLARNGKVFRLERHIRRLLATAQRISLQHGEDAGSLSAGVAEVLARNELRSARVRITLTPGAVGAASPTSVITASPLEEYPRWWYEKGVPVVVCGVRQYSGDPLGGLKTGCYLPRILARQAAAAQGAEEALWFTESGHLAEACFCNVFLVRDGVLATPPLSTPVLAGVVREAIIEICAALNITCRDDQPLSYSDALSADEMFLTSSTAGVRPVMRIDRSGIGDQCPGPVTKKIMAEYENLVADECR